MSNIKNPPRTPRVSGRPQQATTKPAGRTAGPTPTATPDLDPAERSVHRQLEGSTQEGHNAPASIPDPRAALGDDTLPDASFAKLSVMLAAEHLMLLLARGAKEGKDRNTLLRHVGTLVLLHPNENTRKKILLAMADAGRIIDVYPLEVMAYCLERQPDCLADAAFGTLVLNKPDVEAKAWPSETPIRLRVPIAAKLKAMALEGGGFPGYHLYPGAPDEYFVEFGDSGLWTLLLRAEIHQKSVIDRVAVTVVETTGVESPSDD